MQRFIAVAVMVWLVHVHYSNADTSSATYVGCYRENKRFRHFRMSPGNYDVATVTPSICQGVCGEWSRPYAGLTVGKFCFCASSLPVEGVEANDSPCDLACPGSSGEQCGSDDHVSVYRTVRPTTGLEVGSTTSANNIVETFTSVEFDFAIRSGADHMLYSLHYGADGDEHTPQNETGMTVKQFSVPGEYDVIVRAQDADGAADPKEAGVRILVQAPVRNVTLLCPEYVATYDEFTCNATVHAGTFMQAALEWEEDGGTTSNFPIADAVFHKAGRTVPNVVADPSSSTDATGEKYIMWDSEFMFDGYLHAIEGIATADVGDIGVFVMRPNCIYCHQDRTCGSTCGQYPTAECTGGQGFCAAQGECYTNGNLQSCTTVQNDRYNAGSLSSYIDVHTLTISMSGVAGYFNYIIPVDQELFVTAGDVLAYTPPPGGGMLTTRTQVSGEADEYLDSGSSSSTRHYLSAIYSRRSVALFHHTYTTIGVRDLMLNISNDYLDGYEVTHLRLDVLEGINVTVIDNPAYFAAGEAVTFSLEPQTGSNVTHYWEFGDGLNVTTLEMFVDHIYLAKGLYNVSCLSSNNVGYKYNTSSIIIEERFVNLAIAADPAPTHELHPLNFSADSGSDYTCEWDFDGDASIDNVTDDVSGPVSGAQLWYTYDTPNTYTVTVTCTNHIHSVGDVISVVAQDIITGLGLVNTGSLVDMPFYITFDIETGTDASVTLTNESAPMSVSPVMPLSWVTDTQYTEHGIMYFALTMLAQNLVSFDTVTENFTIESMIVGPYSIAPNLTVLDGENMTVVGEGDTALFAAGVVQGSSVRVTWQWHDGTPDDTYYAGLTQGWIEDQIMPHTFHTPGEYLVIVTIENNFNESIHRHTVRVYNPVRNVTLHTNAPAPFLNRVAPVDFWFTVDGHPPTAAQVVFTWGDEAEQTNDREPLEFNISTIYSHTYISAGSFNVMANVSNIIDYALVPLAEPVVTVEPVANMLPLVEPAHAVAGGSDPTYVNISMEHGTGVTLSIHFGDDSDPSDDETWLRTGLTPWDMDSRSHLYSDPGNHTIVVVASNILGNTTMQYHIAVQNPVTPDFTLVSNAPFTYSGSSVTVQLTLSYPSGVTLPDNAEMYWDYGDGVTSDVSPIPFTDCPTTCALDYTVQYDAPGAHTVTLVIRNLATELTFTVETGVYEVLTINAADVYWQLYLGDHFIPGFTASEDQFQLSYDVIFDVDASGTIVEYEVTAEHQTSHTILNPTFTENPIRMNFSEAGVWDVDIVARNGLYDDTIRKTITIVHAPFELAISDGDQLTDRHEIKNISLTFADVSEDTCVLIDWGDNSQEVFGDSGVGACTGSTHVDIADGADELVVSHTYTERAVYEVTVNASSSIVWQEQSITFSVSNLDCHRPAVDIEDINTNFLEPVEIYKSLNIIVNGIVTIRCAETLENTKAWLVEHINDTTGETLQPINLRRVTHTNTASLFIPLRALHYGLYRFTVTVRMNPARLNDLDFSISASTYIRVIPSPLVAQIANSGMGVITRGPDQHVILDPQLYSRDPDIDPNIPQGIESFLWYCRQIDEDYETPMSAIETYPYNANELEVVAEVHHGCFRQGPGILYTDGTNFTEGLLNFTSANMFENQTYQFNVSVLKDTRMSHTLLELTIIPGDPPSVEIVCSNTGFCVTTTSGLEANPSNRLALLADCTDGCDDVQYEWAMYRRGFSDSWIEVFDFDTYVSGLNSREIAIYPRLFLEGYELYSEMNVYRVKLTAWRRGSTSAGTVYTILSLNKGPQDGNCSLSPHSGRVFSQNFTLHCWDWFDGDGIITYQFIARFHDDDVERHLSNSAESTVVTELPLGLPSNDYEMDIVVKIFDRKGAFTEFLIGIATVEPLGNDVTSEQIERLLNAEPSEIDVAMAEGDLQNANTVFLRYATLLNSEQQYDAIVYGDTDVIANNIIVSGGYGPYFEYPDTDPTVDTLEVNGTTNEEVELGYQEGRDQRAQLREEMVIGLASMPLNSIGDLQQTASTLVQLTFAPEEVNRNAQIHAIGACEDMIDFVDDTSRSTSIEELEVAATNILAVIGQVLKAGNVALREPVLGDVDDSRDSEFYYYDTDYESHRQELVGLGAGERAAVLGLESNTEYQSDTMDSTVPLAYSSMDRLLSVLADSLVSGEQPITMQTPQISVTVHKSDAHNLTNQRVETENAYFDLPAWCDMSPNRDCNETVPETISLVSASIPANAFMHVSNAINVPYGSSIQLLTIYNNDGETIAIDNTESPIRIWIPREASDIETTVEEPNVPQSSELMYHCFKITTQHASVHVRLVPMDNRQYLVMGTTKDFPRIKGKKRGWDFMGLSPRNYTLWQSGATDDSGVDQFTVFADNTVIDGHEGKVCIGVRPLEEEEYDLYSDTNRPPAPGDRSDNLPVYYNLTLFTSGCYHYEPDDDKWASRGCTVIDLTDINQTVCDCNHLTAFGGGFVVAPNNIDFDYVFDNADFLTNPTLYVTMILITLVYFAVAIWARRADKNDITKLGVTPLADNDIRDQYLYEVQVSTGSRKNGATDSNVHFILSGDYDETDVRTFEDSKRKILRRGSTDSFLMAVPGPLGPLQFARIWHDNTGKGKFQGWYCRFMVIHDLQTKEKYFFIVNNWFAVEESDGQIDRAIPVAGPENMTEFQHLFAETTRKNLNDEHIWFSVVTRPPQSRFSRLERLSCCLTLLYTSMLVNAMFYQRAPSGSGQNALVIGPFALTAEQLWVGMISNLIVFPVNFLIVLMFRKARPRRKRPSRIAQALRANGYQMAAPAEGSNSDVRKLIDNSDSQLDANGQESNWPKVSHAEPLKPAHNPNTALNMEPFTESPADPEGAPKKKKKKLSFPWWMKIVAWVLLWITVLISAAFVIFYGIQFGDLKCKKWITSMIISFITSIFFTQPIKVFLVALMFSLMFKKADLEEDEGDEDEEQIRLANNEKWLHHYPTEDAYIPPSRPRKFGFQPPDPEILAKARDYRIKELKMYDILREILFYSFFLWILLVISYGFRDPNAFFMKTNLDNLLIDQGLGKVRKISNPWNDFRKITTYDHFYSWLENILIPNIRASEWYNGGQPVGQRGYIGDRHGRIMGYATMRQLRIKKNEEKCANPIDEAIRCGADLCDVQQMVKKYISDLECNKPYSTWDEDTEEYGVGWAKLKQNDTYNNARSEYKYRTGSEIDTYPFWARHAVYSGGGYVIDLKGSSRELEERIAGIKRDEWTDRWTRAVFIEFTVYNPGVNLFGVVTLVAEVLNSGGLSTYHRFEPMNLLGYFQRSFGFQIGCEIAFLFFVVFFIIKEARNMFKQKKQYFKQFWNWIELCIILISICSVTIYFYRMYHANKLTAVFEESGGNAYMKFQYTGYWNELLLYFIGVLCFLATIKFIKLLRFNRRMGMLAATLRHGAKPLCWFAIIFSIMFLAYAQFFYLIYFMEVLNFKTMIHSMETLLQMLVGKFNFSAMQAADPVMGPLIFFFYVVTVYYILLNMFLTILNESFARVRADINLQTNDYEMVEFIMTRFKQWTGLKNILGAGNAEADKAKKETVANQLQKFPEKVDRLLDVLCSAYLNSGSFDDVFSSTVENKQAMKKMLKTESNQREMKILAKGEEFKAEEKADLERY